MSTPNAPMDVIAWALFDMHSDRSDCPYYQGTGDKFCTYGCHDEPHCQTSQPSEGWPMEALRRKYAHILTGDETWGEPVNEDFLAAAVALHALHEAGWRIVRTEDVDGEPIEDVIAEWTPNGAWTPEGNQ